MHARTYGLRAPAARTGRAAGVAGPVSKFSSRSRDLLNLDSHATGEHCTMRTRPYLRTLLYHAQGNGITFPLASTHLLGPII